MNKPASFLFLLITSAVIMAWLSYSMTGKRAKAIYLQTRTAASKKAPLLPQKLRLKASEARSFAFKNKFNPGLCFLIDMSLPSNRKRFFVYDLEKDSLFQSGLVSHGNCNQEWLEGRKFGNEVGCGCTSLGKYRIGQSYFGRFGLAYKLYGLESTNDKAFARYVVLHSYNCVPEMETGDDICQSNGCPMVSPGFLKQLQLLIEGSKKPMLLWIFD
jgi:hypothetical protein